MKPLPLLERAITNSSTSGDRVLDTFMGSGSTLIACERTGRVGLGMEIDPVYVDVAVARWEAFTGAVATRVDDLRNPPSQDELASELPGPRGRKGRRRGDEA